MRKNVNDNSIYMVRPNELYFIDFSNESKEQEKLDTLLNSLSKYQMLNSEFGIKSSAETDSIIEELRKNNDEDSYITAEEVAHALFHATRSNRIIRRKIELLIGNEEFNITPEEYKKKNPLLYPAIGIETFAYVKEFGHYSYEDHIDERVEEDKEILLYENGEFKKVKLNIKSLKLSN